MKRTLCNAEYSILLKEAQILVGSRLEKAYETAHGVFRLVFGKTSLMLHVGKCFFLSQNPPSSPQNPSSFAMFLRKQLCSKFLRGFSQHNNDAIFFLDFSNGMRLVFETFPHGNLLLLEGDKIIRPYSYDLSQKRKFRPGQNYEWSEEREGASFLDEESYLSAAKKVGDAKILSFFQKNSLNRQYASQILANAGIDENEQATAIKGEKLKNLLKCMHNALDNPQFFAYANEPSIMPIDGKEGEKFSTLSQAIEHIEGGGACAQEEISPKQKKLLHRLEEQQKALKKTNTKIQELEGVCQWLEKNLARLEALIAQINEGQTPKLEKGESADSKNIKISL